MLKKIQENPIISLIILCSIIIPSTIGVVSWFYEKQKENIITKHEADMSSSKSNYQSEINALKTTKKNWMKILMT